MPEDYSNSNKGKAARAEKKIQRVTVNEVIIQKPGIGKKIHDVFIQADLGSVWRYVISDVLIPAARNMFVDSVTKGVDRMAYGEHRRGPSGISRVSYQSYNTPVSRSPFSSMDRRSLLAPEPRTSVRRASDDVILKSKDDAERVLEAMLEIIDQFEVASVADMRELMGLPIPHTDMKWGWSNLSNVQIHQVREGWLIDLPEPEPIA